MTVPNYDMTVDATVMEPDDLLELLNEVKELLTGQQDQLTELKAGQDEIIEKLANLGLPGSGFSVEYES